MKDAEKQVKEIETIVKSNLAEGSFASVFARKVATQIVEHYQLVDKDNVTLFSKEELEEKYELSASFMALVRENERLKLKIDCLRETATWYYNNIKNTSKEMIEKFFKEIKEGVSKYTTNVDIPLPFSDNAFINTKIIPVEKFFNFIDSLAKQFGIEIKE